MLGSLLMCELHFKELTELSVTNSFNSQIKCCLSLKLHNYWNFTPHCFTVLNFHFFHVGADSSLAWPLTFCACLPACCRNSRMWTGRSTMQTCPPWPRRPPRAVLTSTSCRSLRCPCQSPSNQLDQVSSAQFSWARAGANQLDQNLPAIHLMQGYKT